LSRNESSLKQLNKEEKKMEKKRLCVVKDPIVKFGTVPLYKFQMEVSGAVWSAYNDPEMNFERGVDAMIVAYKERGHFDYIAIIGEHGLPDVVISSQSFFCKKVEQMFQKAGIAVCVEEVTATNQDWKNATTLIESHGDIKMSDIDIYTLEVSRGKIYAYDSLEFHRDRNVVVYKLTKK
jgi:hypothetical protein